MVSDVGLSIEHITTWQLTLQEQQVQRQRRVPERETVLASLKA